jgi:DNA-binding winged helix-turn-helix (wHTH) protein
MTEIATSVGPPQLPTADFYLGPWLVQPTLGIAARDSVPVHLEPKAMLVLVCLAQHVGAVVSKDELLRAVWPDTFVSEHVLTHAIWQLRHAFHDRDLIATVPRQGYRLARSQAEETDTTRDNIVLPEAGPLRVAIDTRRRLARELVTAIQVVYAVLAATSIVIFGLTIGAALKEPALFARHSWLALATSSWLMVIYASVGVLAGAMWTGRRRVFAAFERWFCLFCPLNILSGLLLLGAAADWLRWRSPASAVILTMLLLPFIVAGPLLQRRLVLRYHLGRVII